MGFLYRKPQRSPLQNQKRLVVISHHHISPLLLTHYKIKTWSVVISHRHISPATYILQNQKHGQSSSLIVTSLHCYLLPTKSKVGQSSSLIITSLHCYLPTTKSKHGQSSSVIVTSLHCYLLPTKIKRWSVVIPHRHISPLLLTLYKIKRGSVGISSNNPFYIFFIDIELQCLEALYVALFNESIPSRSRSHGYPNQS